jgi:hypothetical protein
LETGEGTGAGAGADASGVGDAMVIKVGMY